jgi:hypothetical protein
MEHNRMTGDQALRWDREIPSDYRIMTTVTCAKGDGEFNIVHHVAYADPKRAKQQAEFIASLLVGDHVDEKHYEHLEFYDLSDV